MNSKADPSMFFKRTGTGLTIMHVYVDEILLTSIHTAFVIDNIYMLNFKFALMVLDDLH